MKLSKSQAELLEAMQNGVKCYYMRYMGRFNPKAYYFRGDTMKRCTATAKALLEKGFVEIRYRQTGDHVLIAKKRNAAVQAVEATDNGVAF
jgi:hypothetical protein